MTGHTGSFGEPMSGMDSEGNPLTVSFGEGSKDGHTLLGDDDRREGSDFRNHGNHNHYGPGDGPNDNVKDRGQYHGEGH